MGKKLENADKLNLNAKKKVYINGLNISGTKKDKSNAKILIDCEELLVKDCIIENGCTAYNVFEQKNTVSSFNLKNIKVDNLTCDDTALKHNALSVYNLQDNAEVLIQNSTFNLDVNNSNVIRFANYKNAENVTVTFKNVEWNYEAAASESSDWAWAGLVLYQPAATDVALTGDTSKLATWRFVFENCTYNGVKITGNNFGEHNQALYVYNINKSGKIEDPANYNLKMRFK